MEKFYFKSFVAGGEKFTFTPTHVIPLKDCKSNVRLCDSNLIIPFTEMGTAIKELQENGRYKDFIISEYIAERDRKEAERYWENIHKEVEHKKAIMQDVIADIKAYCSKQAEWVLVYNKLEDCIKDGYFMIYDELYNGHKIIKLKEVGITEYNERTEAR